MTKPSQILVDEHVQILKVISALNHECHVLSDKKPIDKKFFSDSIDFVRNFADKFHHAKEEKIFFVEFCNNAHKAHCNPVEQMLAEHEMGRGYIKGLENALKKENIREIMDNALMYANLLKSHIDKEDNILYPMADEIFDEETQNKITEKFAEVEKEFGEKFINKYISFAEEAAKRKDALK
jgi:hemerythrin-like domain-containing protein